MSEYPKKKPSPTNYPDRHEDCEKEIEIWKARFEAARAVAIDVEKGFSFPNINLNRIETYIDREIESRLKERSE